MRPHKTLPESTFVEWNGMWTAAFKWSWINVSCVCTAYIHKRFTEKKTFLLRTPIFKIFKAHRACRRVRSLLQMMEKPAVNVNKNGTCTECSAPENTIWNGQYMMRWNAKSFLAQETGKQTRKKPKQLCKSINIGFRYWCNYDDSDGTRKSVYFRGKVKKKVHCMV